MRKNVFVIGAGASFDFGLPTGEGLISEIVEYCQTALTRRRSSTDAEDDFIRRSALALRDTVFFDHSVYHRDDLLKDGLSRISRSLWLAKSIDNYLNEQQDRELTALGKALIVTAILRREKTPAKVFKAEDSPLWVPEGQERMEFSRLRDTWLVPFYREFRGGVSKDYFEDRLEDSTFIIFNYDRCFEHFMINALMEYDQYSLTDAFEVFKKIKIIHPYGKIGELEWQSDCESGVAFGAMDDIETAIKNYSRIRTFMETSEREPGEEVLQEVQSAQNLVFLGFGYAEQNLDLLGKNKDLTRNSGDRRRVLGTCYGLSPYRESKAKRALAPFMVADSRPAMRSYQMSEQNVELLNGTCSELINEYGGEWFN
ncbi:hypothetical protein [Roseovarius indicus]|uniref:hypothetical protein n=1 Tax=Roseovarius indicus TaxID=540747 RepID=UPI0032ECF479